MGVDRALVMGGRQHPSLRMYEWSGFSVTAGLFSDPDALLDCAKCQKDSVEIAKRPTGGGLLFHGADLAFSIFIPGPIEGSVLAYGQQINARILNALMPYFGEGKPVEVGPSIEACHFCMSQVALSDLVWAGRKIGGCAQRRTRAGLLHQVSLFITSPPWEKIASYMKDADEVSVMKRVCCSLDQLMDRKRGRDEIKEAIITSFLEWREE